MVAEDARLPRVSATGPIRCPGTPNLNRVKPAVMMVARNNAWPVRTVTGFFCQAARPSLWALIATLKGKNISAIAVHLTS